VRFPFPLDVFRTGIGQGAQAWPAQNALVLPHKYRFN
jgi:hypothetical protein